MPCPNGKDTLTSLEALTPGEVAALFRVDGNTVARWAEDGRLPSFRTPGGHRRYLKSEVLTLRTRLSTPIP